MTFVVIAIDKKPFITLEDDINAYTADMIQGVGKVADNIQARTNAVAKARLSAYPPPWQSKQSKFKWSKNAKKNAKARRWWFANRPESSTGYYIRTGATGRAWKTEATAKAAGAIANIAVNIINPTEGASYVYGYERDGWQRVPSHETTGWLSAFNSPEMTATFEDTFEIILDEVNDVAMEATL